MASKIAPWLSALAVIAVLAIPGHVAAQHQRSAPYPYILIDLGTFGGPNTYLDLPGQTTNASGAVIADADTSTPDPNAPGCLNPDCFVSVGLVWQHGVRTRLDSLPGGSNNAPFSINASGLVAGFSQDGVVDPLTGVEEARAVLWQGGRIFNLGTLPGGRESVAFMVNDRSREACGVDRDPAHRPAQNAGLHHEARRHDRAGLSPAERRRLHRTEEIAHGRPGR